MMIPLERIILDNEQGTLIWGDCLDIMRELPSNCFDAIITDPPFGIGFDYGKGVKDVANTPKDYWAWFEPIHKELLRLVKVGGFVAIWQSSKYFRYFWYWFGDDIRIYAGCKNFVQLAKTPINRGFDPIVVFYTDWSNPLRPAKPKRNLDFFVANTAKFVAQKDTFESKHPCPRPIDQTEQLVDNFVAEGGVIFDPFIGSGTTAVAALRHGRKYFGIDINYDFCQLAKARIEAEMGLHGSPNTRTEETSQESEI